MFKNLKEAFKNKDLKTKLLITILLILCYRIGCWLPVPGIVTSVFENTVNSGDAGATFLSLLSGISGGALANGSLLALGVSPYISASIIVQLLTVAIPSLEKAAKMGEEGRKKISTWTKWCALILAIAQAVGIVIAFGADSLDTSLFGFEASTGVVGTFVVVIMVAGAMFTYWLGEKITEIGVANGMSMLIFVGILSSAGTAILSVFRYIFNGQVNLIWTLVLFTIVLVLIFGIITFMDSSERRVQVSYAKQIKGRKMYGGQSTYIPIRLLGTGVMPIIFASSILTFPQLIMSIFWPHSTAYAWYSVNLGAGSPIYSVLVGVLILFFAYFYSQISFNPDDIARQIQQNGGFILGIRPGKPSAQYLAKISNRVTLFGAIFLAFIAIVPTIIFTAINAGSLINAFSATGMLIVVSVALEFDKQIEALLMMKSYKGFLK